MIAVWTHARRRTGRSLPPLLGSKAVGCRGLLVATLILLSLLATTSATAQKAPEIGYVYPPGGAAGQTIDVTLGGYDWTSDMQVFCLETPATLQITGPGSRMLVPEPPYWFGAKANSAKAFLIPREFPARLTIPADAPPVPFFWQASNDNCTTNTRVIVVGDGPEFTEEQHRFDPQRLPGLPATINGRIMHIEEVDRYVVSAPQTTLVTCELVAQRLGSALNGVLEVRSGDGTLIADAVDTRGVDASLTFLAQAGEDYTVSLHDLDFRGNRAYVYRLKMTTGPRILATVPAVGQRGTATEFELIGVGLATGRPVLESIRRSIRIPPTGADVESLSVALSAGQEVPLDLPAGDIPETVRTVDADGEVRLSAPCGVTARFGGRDEHRYKLAGAAGVHWKIAAQSWRFGAGLDLAVAILGPGGEELAANDDLAGTVDAGLDVTLPADGDYTLVVTNNSFASDSPTSIYRLAVEEPAPDFRLSIPQAAAIVLGEESQLPVTLHRVAGFDGEVAISVAGLPEGVTAPEDLVIEPEASELKIPLTSDNQAAVTASLVTVTGRSDIGEQPVVRIAKAAAGGNLLPRIAADNEVAAMLLAVTMKPRASVEPANAGVSRTACRGTTYPAEIVVKRLEDYDGPVTIQMSAYQQRHRQGLNANEVVIPPGVTHGIFPCYLPEWLETNRSSRMRMTTVVDVPDPQGHIRQLVNYQDAAVSLSLEGALLKVTHADREYSAASGERIEIPVNVLRSARLPAPVTLELIVPEGLSGCLHADAVELPVDHESALFPVQTTADPRLRGMRSFQIRATALQDGKYPAVSQTTVEVLFEP